MPTKQSSDNTSSAPKAPANQGQSLATAGFAVAVASIFTNFFTFGIMAIFGLVLSIMGRVQTGRAGHPNGLALAGIIISAIVGILTFISYMVLLVMLVFAANHERVVCDPLYSTPFGCIQDGSRGQQYDMPNGPMYHHNGNNDSLPNV